MMSRQLRTLLGKIEKLRKRMIRLAKGRSLSDPRLVSVSQELDQLLNQYNRMVKQTKIRCCS